MSVLKAIRAKCIECNCGNAAEVRKCDLFDCPLHPFRFGHNPHRAGIGNSHARTPNSRRDSAQEGDSE